ncbi:MAG: MBL fold metallo-hydrolase [Gammaproteobacteria bacterium]|jgi:glyoxylase-like metal-dependent hydrolase (beta-lactamase superfamily II)|nr:MBL fold metallo-hydrolase [Gammaproteobacteria bacterium]
MKQRTHYLITIALMLFITPAFAANWLPKPAKVSEHAWAWIGPYEAPSKANHGFRMNMGFVVGKEAVAIIDSGYTPEMAREMLIQIRHITSLPVRYVINTNSQPHRYFGNDIFKTAGAGIITSLEAAARMDNEGAQFAHNIINTLGLKAGTIKPPAAPDRLLKSNESTTLALGGDVNIVVTHFGHAHTRGSLVVDVKPDQTVFAGDILYSGRLLAVLNVSNVGGWITAYEKLRTLPAKLFVPGHGPASPLAAFEHPTYAYLTALKTHMDDAVNNGVDANTAISGFDSSRWKNLANYSELAGRNASLMYLESEADSF